MKAKYITVWNGGHEIETSCDYDPETGIVSNVEQSEEDVEGTLDEQYLYLDTNEVVWNFITDDGQTYEDGQLVDDV